MRRDERDKEDEKDEKEERTKKREQSIDVYDQGLMKAFGGWLL